MSQNRHHQRYRMPNGDYSGGGESWVSALCELIGAFFKGLLAHLSEASH